MIDAAFKVHTSLGPGLLESAYKTCLCFELRKKDLEVEREKPMPIVYNGLKLDHAYRMDIVVMSKLVLEIKVAETLTDVRFQQLLTYLKLGNYKLGLLINFNVSHLKNGIKRIIN